MTRLACVCVLLVWSTVPKPAAGQMAQASRYRGNTHTLNSDGDSTPDDVVKWYREQGYDFLFTTDHDMVTNVDPLNAPFDGGGQGIQGSLTDRAEDGGM
jgi:hypothetical protein